MLSSAKKYEPSASIESKKKVEKYIAVVSQLMNEDKYDSAYQVVSQAILYCDTLNDNIGKYYLYAFESEILYYNSLFSSGLNSAYRSLKYAEQLQNDTLVGSIKNLIGLLLSNLHQYGEAEKALRSAVQKLPFNHGNENLSFRFHAASNLCGVFIEKQMPDSAFMYAHLSLAEASRLNRHRAVAIDYWNISKIYEMRKQDDSAWYYATIGNDLAIAKDMEDVQLFFAALLAELAYSKGDKNSGLRWINYGLETIERETTLSIFSKIDFLKTTMETAIKAKDYPLATKLQVLLKKYESQTEAKRNAEQIKILGRFYETEKQLELAETLRAKHEAEAKLNRYFIVGIVALGVLALIIISFSVYTYFQKQKLKTLELQRQYELTAARLEKEKAEEKINAANAERNRIAKELHDDIGSSLSSISLYADLALKQVSADAEKSKSLLEKVSAKSKELSENISDIIWVVYSKNDTFNNLMMRMKNYAFELLAPLNIEVDFRYPYQLDAINLDAEQRKKIYYIFKEALNNAIKYS
jgi:signal transduction histidine kinase